MRKACCEKQGMNKGAWSKQEDKKLIDYIQTHGEGCWRSIPNSAGLLRCGKSCRLRWINYLRPDLKRGHFSDDEEDLIIKLHALLGNRWSLIAGRLPGRTDNEIKNYWNSHIRRKLVKMGVDPNNHRLRHTHPSPNLFHHQDRQIISNGISSGAVKLLCPNNNNNYCDGEVSDATSSLEEDHHRSATALPDLNLDLSANFVVYNSTRNNSSDKAYDDLLKEQKKCDLKCQNIQKDSSTTLHLFRS